MEPEVIISPAEYADLPAMIKIACDARADDVLNRFLYSFDPAEAERKQTEALTVSLGRRFTHPTNRCHILKAVGAGGDGILGWILVRWEDGGPRAPIYRGAAPSAFLDYYAQRIRAAWQATGIPEGPHVVLGALYVRPGEQRRGLGRRLIEHIEAVYGLGAAAAVPGGVVIVQTSGAAAEAFYHRLGWTTISSTDIDLGAWAAADGRNVLEYGVHRSPQMVRGPGTAAAAAAVAATAAE